RPRPRAGLNIDRDDAMTTVQPPPPPAWAQTLDRNRRPVAQGLLAVAGLLLLLAAVLWYRHRDEVGPVAPVLAGCPLMAVAAGVGGAWFLSNPAPALSGADSARLLVLAEGGVLGLTLTVCTFWQMVRWWDDVSGGIKAWQGENRWHLWVLAAVG